jgi:hypothetical protein
MDLHEPNRETYEMGKLSRLMTLLRMMMEHSVRVAIEQSLEDYAHQFERYYPDLQQGSGSLSLKSPDVVR